MFVLFYYVNKKAFIIIIFIFVVVIVLPIPSKFCVHLYTQTQKMKKNIQYKTKCKQENSFIQNEKLYKTKTKNPLVVFCIFIM